MSKDTIQNVQNQEEIREENEMDTMVENVVDYSKYFQGIRGCALIYVELENTYSLYNKELCEKEVSPLSTFKIVSTLAGLEHVIFEDGNTTMKYSGAKYPIDAWNAELTLQEAF